MYVCGAFVSDRLFFCRICLNDGLFLGSRNDRLFLGCLQRIVDASLLHSPAADRNCPTLLAEVVRARQPTTRTPIRLSQTATQRYRAKYGDGGGCQRLPEAEMRNRKTFFEEQTAKGTIWLLQTGWIEPGYLWVIRCSAVEISLRRWTTRWHQSTPWHQWSSLPSPPTPNRTNRPTVGTGATRSIESCCRSIGCLYSPIQTSYPPLLPSPSCGLRRPRYETMLASLRPSCSRSSADQPAPRLNVKRLFINGHCISSRVN